MLTIRCQCGKSLKVPETAIGSAGKCPFCQGSVRLVGPNYVPGAVALTRARHCSGPRARGRAVAGGRAWSDRDGQARREGDPSARQEGFTIALPPRAHRRRGLADRRPGEHERHSGQWAEGRIAPPDGRRRDPGRRVPAAVRGRFAGRRIAWLAHSSASASRATPPDHVGRDPLAGPQPDEDAEPASGSSQEPDYSIPPASKALLEEADELLGSDLYALDELAEEKGEALAQEPVAPDILPAGPYVPDATRHFQKPPRSAWPAAST